ncbi:hypothetical protein J437_LFUL014536 [Ladona fulva]|uniref:DDE Tnp4 domain-containing protein n=1 Tax=Ladona fulva TaxID=123851 RepID=A0A8K0K2U0_LADFU|nr:hypothetical protein J437_LFUL014536 [Ladona fulva]
MNMVQEELAVEDRLAFKNFLRMTEEQFGEILDLVRDDIRKEDTVMRTLISPEKRLALTLRFLATGESYCSLMYSSRIHESMISKIVWKVSDGGVCRKSSLARAVAQESLNFPPNERLGNRNLKVLSVFSVYDAFPLLKHILKPYPNRGLTIEQRNFNYRLSRARRVLENKVEAIVLAAVALHNYLCEKNAANYVSNAQEDCSLVEMAQQAANRATNCSESKRGI